MEEKENQRENINSINVNKSMFSLRISFFILEVLLYCVDKVSSPILSKICLYEF